jgi:hypothetical protein
VRWSAATFVVCMSLTLPAVAGATTRCVGTSGSGCDAVYATIGKDAAPGSAVNAASPGDTIRLGPGVYEEEVSTAKFLHFVGAGAGTLDSFDAASQTKILGPSGTAGKTALTMNGGGSVASMQTVGGNASSLEFAGGGLVLQAMGLGGALDYSVSDVVAIPGTGGYGNTGLSADDADQAINVTVTGGAAGNSYGLSAARFNSPGSSSSMTGVTVRSAGSGVTVGAGTVRIVNSSVLARTALEVNGTSASARAEAVDSVFATPVGPNEDPAVNISTLGAANATLIARGSTFLSRNTGASAGIRLFKGASNTGALSADLLNTIVRVESSNPDAYDLDARTDGTVTADFSSFTTRRNLTGGTTPTPGSANNVFGDPQFTNSPGGDLTLQPGSPLIDRGDPGLVALGELDAAGNPRSQDGNGDCVASPDIGAFERPDACPPGTPPNEAPTVTRFAMTNTVFAPIAARASAKRRKPKRGTRFRYTLSEAARVTITIERAVRRGRRTRYRRAGRLTAHKQAGRQSTRFSGRFKRRALRPGRYRARIVAVDALGARSRERRLRFRVVRP